MSAMIERLCPSESWRSRAIRLRSSATASDASSVRAAWSSRFERPIAPSANSVRQIVPTVTPAVTPAATSPEAHDVPITAASATPAIPPIAHRSGTSRDAVTPA